MVSACRILPIENCLASMLTPIRLWLASFESVWAGSLQIMEQSSYLLKS